MAWTKSQDGTTALEEALNLLTDEILHRVKAGDPIDLQPVLRQYPGCHDQILAMAPAVEAIVRFGAGVPATDCGVATAVVEPPAKRLGDFEIIREIGRGGMGVVYESEQISLGRRVALKVLPFATVLDEQQLNRFKNEARAAGTLDHPNIVSVYSVGSDHGVHYYAMQLIDGHSLDEWIGALRECREARRASTVAGATISTSRARGESPAPDPPPVACAAEPILSPTTTDTDPNRHPCAADLPATEFNTPDYFRDVAELGIQAGEALAYAHENGIVHRDVKPGNLLVNHKGKLWVTDFGLAHMDGDVSMTMSGDIVGTLRYMSPEQTQAPRAVVDHRTDIYSLGATLYELLTLQPACRDTDRAGLLREIAEQDPIWPARLNPAVPRDLATIVGKALEKRPEDRYCTASEMADDLRCFLESRPLHARPPAWPSRTAKWIRRHKRLVAISAVLLLLTSVGLAVSNVMLARERDRAQDNLGRALQAVDQVLKNVADPRLLDAPQLEPLQREMATEALQLCEVLLEENPDDQRITSRSTRARLQQGRIYTSLGEYEAAEQSLRTASQQLERLVQQAGDEETKREHEASLAESYLALSGLLMSMGRYPESAELLPKTIELRQRLLHARPDSLEELEQLADAYGQLGAVRHKLNQPDTACMAYAKAIELWKERFPDKPEIPAHAVSLAQLYSGLALVQEEPQESYEQAIRLSRWAMDQAPRDILARETLARARMNSANWHKAKGRLEEARQANQEASALFESLSQEHPLRPIYRVELGGIYCNQGNASFDARHPEESTQWYTRAVETLDAVLPQLELDAKAQEFLLIAYERRSAALMKLNRYDDALAAFEDARKVLFRLAEERPAVYRTRLAKLLHCKAQVMRGSSQADPARVLEEFQAVVEAWRQVWAEQPDNPDYTMELAEVQWCLSGFLYEMGRKTEFLARRDEAERLLRSLPEEVRQETKWKLQMSNVLGAAFEDEDEERHREALRLCEELVAEEPSNTHFKWRLGNKLHHYANWLVNHGGRFAEAEPLFQRAIQVRQEQVAEHGAKNWEYTRYLAGSRAAFGRMLALAGRVEEGLEAYRSAIIAQTDLMRNWPSADQYKLLFNLYGDVARIIYADVAKMPCPDEQLQSRLQWNRDWLAAYREFESAIPAAAKAGSENNIAFMLATCPDPRLRDVDTAVELARQATLHAPGRGEMWNTLGIVQYRAGDWQGAIESLEKARELRAGGNAGDLLFLGMAHWQLEQRDEARRWWDRAVEWMSQQGSTDESLRQVRAEAAELMGLEDADPQPR